MYLLIWSMSPPAFTGRGSDSVVPRAESSSARFTYKAWASGNTGTSRFAVADMLTGVGVTVGSKGDSTGVTAGPDRENGFEGLGGRGWCGWRDGEDV